MSGPLESVVVRPYFINEKVYRLNSTCVCVCVCFWTSCVANGQEERAIIRTVRAEVSVIVLKNGLFINDIHSVAQMERSMFWEVRVPVVMRRKLIRTSVYLWTVTEIEMFLNLQTQLRSIFVCGVRWRAKFTKERWIHQTKCWLGFWMMLPEKKTWSTTQTNNMRSSHTSCKMHWRWRWDFGKLTVNCNKFLTYL